MKVDYSKIISELTYILKWYSDTKRANVNYFRCLEQGIGSSDYVVWDVQIQESLLEHVWSLPIIAAFFHPYIEEEIDLWRVLQMLAIHDIWEIVLGDEIVFTKKQDEGDDEEQEALRILHKSQHHIYLEFKDLKTNESLFAKSIDKIAPDILDVITEPEITKKRLKHYAKMNPEDIVNRIEKAKSSYMQWSSFFKEFHSELINDLRTKIKTS